MIWYDILIKDQGAPSLVQHKYSIYDSKEGKERKRGPLVEAVEAANATSNGMKPQRRVAMAEKGEKKLPWEIWSRAATQ